MVQRANEEIIFTYIEHAEEEYGQDEEIRHDLKNNMGKIRKVLKGI